MSQDRLPSPSPNYAGRIWLTVLACLTVMFSLSACSGSSNSPGSAPSATAPAGGFSLPGLTDELLLVDQTGDLYDLSATQKTPILTFEDASFVLDPVVSSDGANLAFALQIPTRRLSDGTIDFGSDIYVASTSGGEARVVLKHGRVGEFLRSPAWLPDGKTLLVEVRGRADVGNADWYIAEVDMETGATQRFLADSALPVISPDGKDLASVHIDPATFQEDIVITNLADGSQQSVLDPESTKLLIGSIAWSPDGSQLAFTAADPFVLAPGGNGGRFVSLTTHPNLQDVWVINQDGSGLKRLSDLADSRLTVAWSHDGEHVYVLGVNGFFRIEVATVTEEKLSMEEPGGQISAIP